MADTTSDGRLVTIVVLILLVLVVIPVLAMGGMVGMGPMMGVGFGAVPIWILLVGVVMQLLFLVALVGGAYLVYRAVAGPSGGEDPALAELRLAYARGELTDEEYEERHERLEGDRWTG